MRQSDKDIFLSLVRLGIGREPVDGLQLTVQGSIDWEAELALAERQGLSGVVADGIDWLKVHGEGSTVMLSPRQVMLQLIGSVLQNYEYRHELYRRAIAELAGFYNSHGFKMMVLKGFACALDWPKPEHRPSGDIDIWQFGQYREADAALAAEKGISIDNSHHHHTVFYWRDFMVENHYDFIEIHHHSSGPELEKILKEQGKDDSYSVDLYGEKVYLPSPNLHALFLLRHSMEHFASTDISLRQLLDWAFFVEKHGKNVDWEWLEAVLEQFGMKRQYGIFNAICVEELGFDAGIFHYVQYDPNLKERVLNEILSPEFIGEAPEKLIPRILLKYRRWQANGWKQKLCYKGSRWSAFWSATWNHLLKPNSI